jgi:N-acetylglucosamine kinase-like BadF-type ATPase
MSTLAALVAEVGNPVVAVVAACVANLDTPEQEELFAAAVARRGWGERVLVRNDTYAVLRGGVDGGSRHGIAVVCGSGINCLGVGPDGGTARFLAFGEHSGDWGGGNDIGRAGLWHASRAEDGRGEPTALRSALLRHLGRKSMRDVALDLKDGNLTDADVRGCTPVVFEWATGGDPVAVAIVRRQSDEICAMVRVVLNRLDLAEVGTTVVLGGGVVTSGHALLVDAVRAGIAGFSPDSTIVVTREPPVVGAALLGIDTLGERAPQAEHRLRSYYRSGITASS